MAASRPGNLERGWNDPPMFFYNVDSNASNATKKASLNKRVAFPQDPTTNVGANSCLNPGNGPPPGSELLSQPAGNSSPPKTGKPVLLPPCDEGAKPPQASPLLSSPEGGAVVSTSPPVTSESKVLVPPKVLPDEKSSDSDQLVEILSAEMEAVEILEESELFALCKTKLQKVFENCKSCLQARALSDIQKRLAMFEDWWQKGKLSQPVKTRMAQLSQCLERGNCDMAHELHLALMIDYAGEVGQWMVGIKKLIQETRNLKTTEEKDESEVQSAAVVSNPAVPVFSPEGNPVVPFSPPEGSVALSDDQSQTPLDSSAPQTDSQENSDQQSADSSSNTQT
ncbi:steroid receptor RNA activator 1 [Lingula anatina]|uniref:Steroid receptor RNA activator 1 n=1 Tax=Lingula anatina TaxID=7574 RepID=A0A1S3HL12_LINAN|nr:steroid receptor RNA activator 1 [Lingula anatina]|eukprot:XP_013386712.1 steroid receptor RNA activator 1 [Lingula anatina]